MLGNHIPKGMAAHKEKNSPRRAVRDPNSKMTSNYPVPATLLVLLWWLSFDTSPIRGNTLRPKRCQAQGATQACYNERLEAAVHNCPRACSHILQSRYRVMRAQVAEADLGYPPNCARRPSPQSLQESRILRPRRAWDSTTTDANTPLRTCVYGQSAAKAKLVVNDEGLRKRPWRPSAGRSPSLRQCNQQGNTQCEVRRTQLQQHTPGDESKSVM